MFYWLVQFRKQLVFSIFFFSCFFIFYFYQTYKYSNYYWIIQRRENQQIVHQNISIQDNSFTSYTTIVSIYYQLEKSKHSHLGYDTWITNMLKSVENAPLVMFTDRKSADFIIKRRKNKLQRTRIIIHETVFDVLKELGEKRGINYVENYLDVQNNLDPERIIHNPFLYAVWNLKSYFVQKVIEANPFQSKFFIYTDAGAWRSNVIPNWPDNQFIEKLDQNLTNRVLIGQMSESYNEENYFSYSSIIQGTFFAGSSKAIQNYFVEFWRLHDDLLKKNQFLGKDQLIMKMIAFDTFSKDVVRLKNWEAKCNVKFNPWFFYQLYFSKNYPCSNDRFSLLSF
jgi:hypothetical protein